MFRNTATSRFVNFPVRILKEIAASRSESVVVIIYFTKLDSAVPKNVVSCFEIRRSTYKCVRMNNNSKTIFILHTPWDVPKDKEISRNTQTAQHKKRSLIHRFVIKRGLTSSNGGGHSLRHHTASPLGLTRHLRRQTLMLSFVLKAEGAWNWPSTPI